VKIGLQLLQIRGPHQVQDVHPGEPVAGGGRVLVQHDDCDLRHDLQRDDHHQDLLLPVRQEHLRPTINNLEMIMMICL